MKFTSFAVGAGPSGEANFAAVVIAFVVAELVVPRAAEFHAGGVVVVGVALNADAVRHLGRRSVVRQRMPVGAGYQNTRIYGTFDFSISSCMRTNSFIRIRIAKLL